jgi:hypothetical protein
MNTIVEATGYDTWLNEDPARRCPHTVFGDLWTTQDGPGEYRVSYVDGTGELIAVDEAEREVRVLGRYRDLYTAEDAIGPWPALAGQSGSLDRLYERFPDDRHLITIDAPDPRAVFGLVIDVNGDRERIHEPLSDATLAGPFPPAFGDIRAIPIRIGQDRLVLFAEKDGLDQSVNPTATLLAGTGHPILGRALVANLERPMDPSLVDGLDPPRSMHREWVARDFTRLQPDIDYGTTWTSSSDLDETWRVSWNPGSGELYRLNDTDTALQVLGTYPDRAAVDTVLEGWGSLARQPGGLDQVERFHALVEQRNQLSEQGLRDENGDLDFVSIRDLGSGMPDVVERRFVDRVDQLEQRLALTDDPDPSTDLDPSDTLDPDPDLNDEMDIS